MKIAIVAVAYNRVNSLKRLLTSLEKAIYSDFSPTLIISVDKSNTNIVEEFADGYCWPHGEKIVDKHDKNLGLRPHMLSLGKWFDKFDAIIVLEDDIVVSPNFFLYSKQAVEMYNNCSDIAGISLYGFSINYQTGLPFMPLKDEHDAYFMNCAMSWGEVWMRDSWSCFYKWYLLHQDFPLCNHLPKRICNWNQKSWLKYHTRYCIEENKYFVYPYVSLSTNYGDAGVHNNGGANTTYQVELQYGDKCDYILPDFGATAQYYDGFFENKALYKHFDKYEKELCIDLQGEWGNRLNKRYWLTTQSRDFKVIKSFGLNYRPIELNILLNNPGNHIFLYDTHTSEKHLMKSQSVVLLYKYRIHDMVDLLREYGLKNVLKDFFNKIENRIG